MNYKGKAHKVGEHIDTDAIIPARFLVTSDPEKLGENCMSGLEPDWVKRVSPGDIMVAGRNFGCGSSREHAPIAILGAGMPVVIGHSFARIFYRNAFNMGLLLLEVGDEKQIQSVAVVGGGRMGRQIAMSAAIAGFDATVYDVADEVCADVESWAEEYLAGRIAKGRLTTEQVAKVKELFRVERDLQKAVANVDLVVEAIIEDEDIKRKVLKNISEITAEDTIIATNSSVMVSSKFAGDVKNPSRLCNVHYYFPALVMKFVEVVQGEHTADAVGRACYNFCIKCGKKPVLMNKELPGFLCNYIYSGLMERARYVVEHGYCTPQDVDAAMEYGFNYKMGPFRTQDIAGFHVTYAHLKKQYEATGKKPDMFDYYTKMIEEGRLGKAVGKGFYDYN